MNVLLDPYILAVPDDTTRIEAYLMNLYRWTTAISTREHTFWLTNRILHALWDLDLYPKWETLRVLESRNGVYNVNTLLRACEAELTLPPLLDKLVDNQQYYFEEHETVVVPPAIMERLSGEVAVSLREALALAALGKEFQPHGIFRDLKFGTAPDGFDENILSIDFMVRHIETYEESIISQALEILVDPDDVEETVDIDSIWQDTQRTIIHVHRKLFASNTNPPVCPTVNAGPAFNQSILAHNVNRRPALLFKVFRITVLGLIGEIARNQKTHHNLHVNGVPVNRGKITAWRLWIEHTNPGWRLHYWLYPDGNVELANLVVHDDYTISEPTATGLC